MTTEKVTPMAGSTASTHSASFQLIESNRMLAPIIKNMEETMAEIAGELKARYARETDKAERDKIAAAYAETANAAKTDFEAIAGIAVDEGKLRLA